MPFRHPGRRCTAGLRSGLHGSVLTRTGECARGFSLIELLIATTIGAGLLVTLAAAAALFSQQVTEVRSGQDQRLDQALALVTRTARYGWAVERPSSSSLHVTDPYGARTDFFLEDGALMLSRPNGETGVLLGGVSGLDFVVQTRQRLRELPPDTAIGTFWTAPAPAGATTPLVLQQGHQLALGFTLPADAAASWDDVPGVDEQRMSATLNRLLLPCSWLDAGNKSFCHLHASQPHSPNHPSGQSRLSVTLYEARTRGDARPLGAALGSTSVSVGALPGASYTWWDTATNTAVSPPAGVAWGWWDNHPTVVLQVSPQVSASAISLTGIGAVLKPGRAYTLVLSLNGYDQLTVGTKSVATSKLSGVALLKPPSTSLVPQAFVVQCAIEGNETVTQTQAFDVVTGVTVTVELEDGRTLSGTTNVAGQIGVEEAWLGAAPGDLPELELAGS